MVKESDGYLFWKEKLGSAKYVLAPMVDQSELPWRLMSRKYGAQLCYSPMLHASVFIKDLRYRKENLSSCNSDRPLIIQFCANDPEIFIEAALLAQDHCDAIDLNVGCPQTIAQRGHYGAFLENDWSLLTEMVSSASKKLHVPVTCKIRIFSDIERTVSYAKMLETAGCQLLAVHGRTKEQKGPHTGLASWDHIKAVKASVGIPVFANGNIQCLQDVENCIIQTGVDGVMIAEGSLHNPALFKGISPPVWEMALEYLNLVERYPCSLSCVRGHIFKLCHHCLVIEKNHDIRQRLAFAKDVKEFISAIAELQQRYEVQTVEKHQSSGTCSKFGLPPWICQPYERPPPVSSEAVTSNTSKQKRAAPDSKELNGMSKNKFKKLMKCPRKGLKEKKVYDKCCMCSNPKGTKCTFNLCKVCCKSKVMQEVLDCHGHRFLFATKCNSKQSGRLDAQQNCELT